MNVARILILVVAAGAAVAAALLVRGAMQPPPAEETAQAREPEPAPMARVLAARDDLPVGHTLQQSDLYWQDWPEGGVSPSYLTESANADAIDQFAGAVVRSAMGQGEPVTARRVVQPGSAGFMAAVVEPGMRAIAVPTSARASAGGFILPNDRVDVIVTQDGNDGASSETLLENIRVLAIDQIFADGDESAVVGSTATLEVTPGQARALSQAASQGSVSLALRSLSDANAEVAEIDLEQGSRSVRVFRRGQEQRVALGNGG